MTESLDIFSHTKCYDCSAINFCRAGKMSLNFIQDTMETQLDRDNRVIKELEVERGALVIDQNEKEHEEHVQMIANKSRESFNRHRDLSESFNELMRNAVAIQEVRSQREVSYAGDSDPEIDVIRNQFIQRTSGSLIVVPTHQTIRVAADGVIRYRETGECRQFPQASESSL
jgi:hypothetical protein